MTSCKSTENKTNGQKEIDATTEMTSTHNSRNSLDWAGVYKGTLPCADCEGIQTEIKLNQDLSYSKAVEYLGKNDGYIKTDGAFTWDENGSIITLSEAENDHYKVGENVLFVLDPNGKQITGALSENYQLKKVPMDTRITEKYWRLIELNGNTITTPQDRREIHMILKDKDSMVNGFSGCNTFNGTYELNKETGKLKFTKMKSTMMACDDIITEDVLQKVIAKVDTYTLKNDTLSITKAKMAPSAIFQAVYFK